MGEDEKYTEKRHLSTPFLINAGEIDMNDSLTCGLSVCKLRRKKKTETPTR
jgi:hypothetical protein